MNNNSNNCGDCGTTCSECGRPWAICKQDGGCGCNKCKDIKFCEYGRMANGCIREKQPGCPMQAVIPSVTVESIEGIKNLADCLVHVSDINTTFYIDDKHRPIITWAGPVDIPGYDMDGNPNNYRDQIVTDVANQMAVIYDKSGKGYLFGLAENIDLQEQIDNKLDEMSEDGTLQEIIGDYLNANAVWGFDTVADMKASTNLISGSYAKTLGYYAKNDGGGATYKIREITNDDVVDEATIIEMGDGSNQLIAELIIEEPINVKTLGVYGDGTHDDYAKIQHGIDIFHHHTLFFPNGTYLITQPIAIGTTNAEQVDFKLDSGATIKSDTPIDSLLEIGKYEGSYNYYSEGSTVSIDGGNWDATNCQRAIYTTSNRKNSILKNLNIYNVSHYGIYAIQGTNTSDSADLNIDNVMINGTGSEGDSVGLYLQCYDNKIRNVRVNKCTIGVYDRGGSFFENVHCLASWTTGSLNQTNYEKTIGFKFQGGGVSKLSQCYSDTFGIGFEFNTPMKVYLDNCQSYHYLTNLEYKTILFKDNETNANLRLCVSDFDWTPPSVTGTGKNVGLDLSATNKNFREFLTTFKCFRFCNFNANEIGRTQEFDYIWCQNLHDNRCVTTRPAWTVTMQQNKYYPIAILGGLSQYNLQIGMANDQMIQANFASSPTPNIRITNIRNNSHTNNYTLALCNTELVDGVRRTYLCIKSSDSDSGFNPSVTGFDSWANQYIARPTFISTPLDSPTVVAEASFNP